MKALVLETKAVYRNSTTDKKSGQSVGQDYFDLRLVVFDRSDNSLCPDDLMSANVILMKSTSKSKQVLQRVEFDRNFKNSDGTYRVFFLHPSGLDNLFYQVDATVTGGLEYSKVGTFAKVASTAVTIADQPGLEIPTAPPTRDPIGDPLSPFADLTQVPWIPPTQCEVTQETVVLPPISVDNGATCLPLPPTVSSQPCCCPCPIPSPSGGPVLELVTAQVVVEPGFTIPPHGVVAIDNNGKAIPSVDSSDLIRGTIGVNMQNRSYTGNQQLRVILTGRTKVNNGGVPLQIGQMAWVGATPGTATTNPPPGPNRYDLKLGVAIRTDEIALSIADVTKLI